MHAERCFLRFGAASAPLPRRLSRFGSASLRLSFSILCLEATLLSGSTTYRASFSTPTARARRTASMAKRQLPRWRLVSCTPARVTAAQPRQVTSPWSDGPRWSAIDGRPPRAWMSVPLRSRLWYLDYVHCTDTLGVPALRWRRVWRAWRVGRCAGDATLTVCSRCTVCVSVRSLHPSALRA